ncbi:hypothetical protein ABZ819_05075 [Streptomyces venezuelae]|uniref:hypothetical protein n=1 Tax=Streptomyces venezuelae TaxID=54571 RepID=UPI00344537A2
MNEIVNADPATLAILGGTLCALALIVGVVLIAHAAVQSDDRQNLPDCFRALGDLVRSFRR